MTFSHRNATGWQFLLATLILITGIIVLFSYRSLSEEITITNEAVKISNARIKAPMPEIEGEAAVVWDANVQQIVFSKEADEPLPLASITKLITAIAAIETLPANATVTIKAEDLDTEGESGLIQGDSWQLRELVGYMLSVSSNDAAEALARATEEYLREQGDSITFTMLMNRKAADIGMRNSKFYNASGLDVVDGVEAGATGSANDVIRLMQYIYNNHPDIGLQSTSDNTTFTSQARSYTVDNTNEIIDELPHMSISKTGFTYLAGGNLAVMVDLGIDRPLYIVVLGSSSQGRFRDVDKLFAASVEVIQNDSNYVSSSN
jgi:D-alanyl-D-alanine carboxypeptidase